VVCQEYDAELDLLTVTVTGSGVLERTVTSLLVTFTKRVDTNVFVIAHVSLKIYLASVTSLVLFLMLTAIILL